MVTWLEQEDAVSVTAGAGGCCCRGHRRMLLTWSTAAMSYLIVPLQHMSPWSGPDLQASCTRDSSPYCTSDARVDWNSGQWPDTTAPNLCLAVQLSPEILLAKDSHHHRWRWKVVALFLFNKQGQKWNTIWHTETQNKGSICRHHSQRIINAGLLMERRL